METLEKFINKFPCPIDVLTGTDQWDSEESGLGERVENESATIAVERNDKGELRVILKSGRKRY